MPQLSTTQESSAKHILVYGPPKSGKSLLVGKLAEHFNLIWFDLESGHDVLYQLPKSQQERIQLISIPDTSDYPIAIETCLKVIRGGPGWVCSEHGKVNCPRCIDRSTSRS
jgi:DNA polymerase III delta prime subunit